MKGGMEPERINTCHLVKGSSNSTLPAFPTLSPNMTTPSSSSRSETSGQSTHVGLAHICQSLNEDNLSQPDLDRLKQVTTVEKAAQVTFCDSFQSQDNSVIGAAKKARDDATTERIITVDTLYSKVDSACAGCKEAPISQKVCTSHNQTQCVGQRVKARLRPDSG